MPEAMINGINISFEDHGSGFPVVLTHGYASSSRMWQGQIAPLTQRYRLITWDMRGHGQTDSPAAHEDYSEALTVEDLRGLMAHCGVEQAVVGGLSLGGYMSLAFYLAHPEMVRALIVCDAGPGYRNEQARAQWNETAFRRAENFEQRGLDALGRSAEVQAARSAHRSAEGLAKAARGMLAQFDSRVIEGLEHIAVPTLLIVGEEDALTPPKEARAMHEAVAGSRLEIIPGAGHVSNAERPAAFNQVVGEFLREVAGASPSAAAERDRA